MRLVNDILKGDEYSAARLISQVEDGRPEAYLALSKLFPHTGSAFIVGITGPAGAGKSTLTGRLAVTFANQGKKVGVIATDPTSIKGSGALLGDRLRMKEAEKKGIFIRSMAQRGYPGGIARATASTVYILEGLGKDIVILESTGAGQSEKGLFYLCDTVITLFTPDYGDDIQLMKAGLIEIGDIIVINKADKPGAANAERDFAMISSGKSSLDGWHVPILLAQADRGEGMEALVQAIQDHWRCLLESGKREAFKKERLGYFLMNLLKEELWEKFAGKLRGSPLFKTALEDVSLGKTDPYSAIAKIVDEIDIKT